MKVKELIELLSKYDGDMPVAIWQYDSTLVDINQEAIYKVKAIPDKSYNCDGYRAVQIGKVSELLEEDEKKLLVDVLVLDD